MFRIDWLSLRLVAATMSDLAVEAQLKAQLGTQDHDPHLSALVSLKR